MAQIYDSLSKRELEVIKLLAERLSNSEIADCLFVAPSTVKWYIRELNSKLYTNNRKEIVQRAEELGLLSADVPEPDQSRHNLPRQTTPFVGRDAELDEVHTILEREDVRLLTILAPGGMGKTRLALEAAEQQTSHYPDGVYFVPLQPLSDPDNIISQIATSSGFHFMGDERSPKQQVLDFLGNKTLLLLLDNFEHLLDGVDLVNEILQAAPDVRLLVTSREKLNLSSETVYVLRGMEFPTWETPEDALRYDAVKLLLQAAQRVKPDWSVTEDNLQHIGELCRLTQGMPLGILLAASWLDVMSLQRITEEIQHDVDMLETEQRDTPERHRSIRASFDYSWSRLTGSEQQAFMKLSVFQGGFTVEAAQTVAESNVRLLRRLVNKSLVLQAQQDRYDLHELLRQYAEVKLAEANMTETVHDAHMNCYANFMRNLEDDLKGGRQVEALNEIEVDLDNVINGWVWAVEQGNYAAIDWMMDSLLKFDWMRMPERPIVPLLDAAFQQIDENEHPFVYGRLTSRLILIGSDETTNKANLDMLEKSLQIARDSEDQQEILWTLQRLAMAVDMMGQPQQAWQYYKEAEMIAQSINDDWNLAMILRWLVYIKAGRLGQYDGEALPLLQESITIYRRIGDKMGLSMALNTLSAFECLRNKDYRTGKKLLQEAMALGRELSPKSKNGGWLVNMSRIYTSLGEAEEAEQYLIEMLSHAQYTNDKRYIASALREFSYLKTMQGDYKLAEHYAQEGLALMPSESDGHDYWWLRINQGIALCGLEHYADAAACLYPSIRPFAMRHEGPHVVMCVIGFLLLLTYYEVRHIQAVELASFIAHYHGTIHWEVHPLIPPLLEHLQANLNPETYQAAWERGKTLDLDTVVTELVEEFGVQA